MSICRSKVHPQKTAATPSLLQDRTPSVLGVFRHYFLTARCLSKTRSTGFEIYEIRRNKDCEFRRRLTARVNNTFSPKMGCSSRWTTTGRQLSVARGIRENSSSIVCQQYQNYGSEKNEHPDVMKNAERCWWSTSCSRFG